MQSINRRKIRGRLTKSTRPFIGIALVSLLAACGSDEDIQACAPGLIGGFAKAADNTPLSMVAFDDEGVGADGDGGSVGGGDGVGIGGADGQYRNVAVTIETATGLIYGPKVVDDTKGMVTFVGCGNAPATAQGYV